MRWSQDGITFVVGAEITVESPVPQTYERHFRTATYRTFRPSWNFTSSEKMENWDVILCVADTKFFAHKTVRVERPYTHERDSGPLGEPQPTVTARQPNYAALSYSHSTFPVNPRALESPRETARKGVR